MLGIHDLSRSATEPAPGRRTAHALLALAAAAAAVLAISGTAQAQDCAGGYRMIKGEIPVQCDTGFAQPAFSTSRAMLREPLHTGSIGAVHRAVPVETRPAVTTSSSGLECVGGYSYRETPANGWTLPMRCE